MVKCKIGLVIIFIILCLAGCGNKNTLIVQEKEAWDYVDVKISGIPENAYVCAVASNGIYYEVENSTDYSGAEPTSEYEFHFLDYSGNDRMLLQKSNMNTYNIINIGDNMLLCDVTVDGMEIIKFSSDGNIETLFTQNAPQFPFIQSYENYVVSIRNNFAEDFVMYENTLILQDTEKNEEKVIYRALWNNEKARGEDIGCVSINDETVCFTLNKFYEGKEKEYILCLYDIDKEKIVEEIVLPTRVYYAAYGGDKGGLLLSETDDYEFIEEAGSIGYIKDDVFVETAKIPLISASNMINDGSYTGSGYYFTTYKTAYYWDTKANKIYVYDYQWDERRGSIFPTENGLKFVVDDGDSTFIRTVSVK